MMMAGAMPAGPAAAAPQVKKTSDTQNNRTMVVPSAAAVALRIWGWREVPDFERKVECTNARKRET